MPAVKPAGLQSRSPSPVPSNIHVRRQFAVEIPQIVLGRVKRFSKQQHSTHVLRHMNRLRSGQHVCKGSVEASPATPKRIGVLGGGQLGKMLGLAAARMGIVLKVLDPTENCPAASVAGHVVGDFSEAKTVRNFVTDEDVLTVEIEHVDANAMRDVQSATNVDVEPTPETLEIIQDKFKQKEHFNHNAGLKVTSYIDVSGEGTGDLAVMVLGLPFMLKAKRWAYDGRGNAVVRKISELEAAVDSLGGYKQGLYGEKWVSFTKEVAVMVAKDRNGKISSFPVTETVHKDSILHITQTPAQIPDELLQQATELAERAVESLEGAGIFGVEMFLMEGGELVLNEVAPRPHNSGHYTIEACSTSQFEQHLRAISGLPLGDSSLKVNNSIMLNILGEADGKEGEQIAKELIDKAYQIPGTAVHWYGKKGVSKKRKIGHITIVDSSAGETLDKLAQLNADAAESLKRTAKAFEEDWQKVQEARQKARESAEDSAGSGPAVLACRVDHQKLHLTSESPLNEPGKESGNVAKDAEPLGHASSQSAAASSSLYTMASVTEPASVSDSPQVAIIMGSDSDLPTMQAAADVLAEFKVAYQLTIVSAHRTPDRMLNFARSAHHEGIKVSPIPSVLSGLLKLAVPAVRFLSRADLPYVHSGGQVIVAGAGGAAHLPGMVASLTPLPVIGVPVTPKGAHLDGLDALMSIVQMPKGVPVATVAIGNAANAGLLAIRILASSNAELLQKMLDYQETMKQIVLAKAEKLDKQHQS